VGEPGPGAEEELPRLPQVNQKVIGPRYKEVAQKYAGQPDAVAKLVPKVMKGGSASGARMPMPANPQSERGRGEAARCSGSYFMKWDRRINSRNGQ
jgi:hypothetical protein